MREFFILYDLWHNNVESKVTMNVINIELPDRVPHPFEDERATIPVAIPDLDAVSQFGKEKHALRQLWRGTAFGWPAEYRPAENLPAGFFIGVNGIYFVSLDWELGTEEEPLV